MAVLAKFADVNYLAVLVATVAYFVLGALWYSPVLFVKPWIEDSGIDPGGERGNVAPLYIATAVLAFISALTLAVFLGRGAGAANGLVAGLVAGLGLVAAPMINTGLFEGRKPRLIAINAGYYVVALAVAGVIIGAWQ